MTGGTQQRARIDAAVMVEMAAKVWPVRIADETHPEFARARAHRAAMTPERRAELDAEWADFTRDRAEDDAMVAEWEQSA